MTHATLLSAAVGLSAADAATANPLLTESTLPFHYPRFDLIKNAHFLPAYEAGMAAQLAEVAAIASATAAPAPSARRSSPPCGCSRDGSATA